MMLFNNWYKRMMAKRIISNINYKPKPTTCFDMMKKIEMSLRVLNKTQLRELTDRFDEWFLVEEDIHSAKKEKQRKTNFYRKDSMIKYIMSGDPIMEEGGLISFLIEYGVMKPNEEYKEEGITFFRN